MDELLEKSTRFWLMEQIRNHLRDLRNQKGLTQTEVGDQLGKDQVFVSNCESGRRRLDPVELMGFLSVYDVSMDEFLDSLNVDRAVERDYAPTS